MIYGYARVSTDEQSDSLDAQVHRIREWAAKQDIPFGGIYVDEDVSAYRVWLIDRPDGKKLCDILKTGDVVCITAQDRLFRSVADSALTYEKWKALGVRMFDLSKGRYIDSVDDETMFQLLAVIANDFSRRAGYRLKAVFDHKRRMGLPYSRLRPFGWVRDGDRYVPCDQERAVAERVVRMREAGKSWNQITLALYHENARKPFVYKGHGYYTKTDAVRLYVAARAGYPKMSPNSLRISRPEQTPCESECHGSQPGTEASAR